MLSTIPISKINCLIGDIVSGFVRTEFLLSQILYEIGFRETRINFFANGRIEEKLSKIRLEFEESNIEERLKYISLIDQLDKLRKKRNIVVHSLVLTNVHDNHNHIFHNYRLIKGNIENNTIQFNTSDLENIHAEICDLHNAFYILHFKN